MKDRERCIYVSDQHSVLEKKENKQKGVAKPKAKSKEFQYVIRVSKRMERRVSSVSKENFNFLYAI